MQELINKVRSLVQARWQLGPLHGIAHWNRVFRNGQQLLGPDVNARVVALFAYLHDSCRENDGFDLEHGPRAARWIDTIRDSYLAEVPDDEIELLKEACRLHTKERMTGNPTIDACFDADRLDLWRIGVTPDPERLATEKGKKIARETDYERIIDNYQTFSI